MLLSSIITAIPNLCELCRPEIIIYTTEKNNYCYLPSPRFEPQAYTPYYLQVRYDHAFMLTNTGSFETIDSLRSQIALVGQNKKSFIQIFFNQNKFTIAIFYPQLLLRLKVKFLI